MKNEPEETFPQEWTDADENAMFDAASAFTQTNRNIIKNTTSHKAIAQNSFIEGFIACFAYCHQPREKE